MNIIKDLSKFGYRELNKAEELINALKKGNIAENTIIEKDIKLMFNTGSGYVFFGNDEGQTYLLNEDLEIEEWVFNFETEEEGFKSEIEKEF